MIRYVDFCVDNSLDKHIPFKTQRHHILPKSKFLPFVEYKNFMNYPWNCSILFSKDHYIAHSLLTQAIDNDIIYLGWSRMNQDISFREFLAPELYQKIYEESLITRSKFQRGKKRSEQTKINISKSLTGRKLSESHTKNMSIAVSNLMTEEHRKHLSKKCSGRKHTPEEIDKQIKAQTGKRQKTVKCPHCNKEGGNVLMTRWHFDSCKLNPDLNIDQVNKNKVECPHCKKLGGINVMKRWHFDNCKDK